MRHAVPLPKVVELRGVVPENWEYRSYRMTQNDLFSVNFAQMMTDHVYIHTIIPTGPGTCISLCMMLIPETPKTDKAERYCAKNYDLIRSVFEEDFVIGEGIQNGFAAHANAELLFGKFACGLQFGQKSIDEAVAGRLTV